LKLEFENGQLSMFSCSLKWIERNDARKEYDSSIDIMSRRWNARKALARLAASEAEEIGNVLLDQDVFAGVGNIIKNEVLWLARVHPSTRIKRLSPADRKSIIAFARSFSKQFLRWRRKFVLRKNLSIYGRKVCPRCGGTVKRAKTGNRERWSYVCGRCQPRE
jgi:endonuclease-8